MKNEAIIQGAQLDIVTFWLHRDAKHSRQKMKLGLTATNGNRLARFSQGTHK
ncbi:MAG: hypothetical protein INF74_00980 [Roseomonas sp.]|nr:hypothetical protein [Roseomonas sp.]